MGSGDPLDPVLIKSGFPSKKWPTGDRFSHLLDDLARLSTFQLGEASDAVQVADGEFP